MHPDYLRSVVFGFEDGLVSTTGAIVGVAVGADDIETVVLAGLVVVVVESLSMGAGQLLSERAVHQLDPSHVDSVPVGAGMMTAAYALAGSIPLTPVLVLRTHWAVAVGVALSFVALFVLGVVKGRAVGVSKLRSGAEIFAVGGLACGAGIAVGLLVGT